LCPFLCTIWFDDLILRPSLVEGVISRFLRASPVKSFESHGDTFEAKYVGEDGMGFEAGGFRSFDAEKVCSWEKIEHRERLKKQIITSPSMLSDLVYLGFENDSSWVAAL